MDLARGLETNRDCPIFDANEGGLVAFFKRARGVLVRDDKAIPMFETTAAVTNPHVIISYSQSLTARRTVSTNVLLEPTTAFEPAKFA